MAAALQIAALQILFVFVERNQACAGEVDRIHLIDILVKTLSSQFAHVDDGILQCLIEMIQNSSIFTDLDNYEQMIADLVTIIDVLLETPREAKTVSLLWNFIVISHPANATYLEHDIQKHRDWINSYFPPEDVYDAIDADTKLCSQLRQYMDLLGSDFISSMWRNGSTVFDIRREFDQKRKHLSDEGYLSNYKESFTGEAPIFLSEQQNNVDMDRNANASPLNLKWIASLRRNMVIMMSDILQNGSDELFECIQRDMMSWEAILILLTEQEDVMLREAVSHECLQQLRSSSDTQAAFLRMDGFKILANQLVGSSVSHSLADSLFSLMCGEPVFLSDGLDVNLLVNMNVTRASCESFYAIFVALEESVMDPVLFWNMTSALLKNFGALIVKEGKIYIGITQWVFEKMFLQVFENNVQLQQAMLSCNMAQYLVNILRKIAYLDASKSHTTDETTDTYVLLDAWLRFTQLILTSVVPYNDVVGYEVCEQFIFLLIWADWQSSKDDYFDEYVKRRAHNIIRENLCQLLRCWLDCIEHVFIADEPSVSVYQSKESLYSVEAIENRKSLEFVSDETKARESTTFISLFSESITSLKRVLPTSKNFLDSPFPKRSMPLPIASLKTLHLRLLFILEEILNVYVVLRPAEKVSAAEENLFIYYISFMQSCLNMEQQDSERRESAQLSSMWIRIQTMSYHRVRVFLAQLTSFVVFSAQMKLSFSKGSVSHEQLEWQASMRQLIIKSVLCSTNSEEYLRSLMNVNLTCILRKKYPLIWVQCLFLCNDQIFGKGRD
ncbi:hypothetical protein DICVIV_09982 [Dictyocaulus viviparus]|uniref:Uncharacterized protein n=1 Tax=Dictyocaulus viviparus TaxID=29172 RepID=A0A0D8XJI2_DICVI|nr:hypothetical protein DICVIV_09982 [Dictyocaulus viviparus]